MNSVIEKLAEVEETAEAIVEHARQQKSEIEKQIQEERNQFDRDLEEETQKKLEKIKAKISELDHWTEKQETRDDVETYIGAILWEELPESYSDNAIFAYRQKIYEYVFMRYKEVA